MTVLPLVILLLAPVPAAPAPTVAPGERVLYLVSTATPVRAEPSVRSRTIARLRTFDIVAGRETTPGWLELEASSDDEPHGGWIPFATADAVAGTMEQLRYRLFRVRETKWPDQVKIEVARGHIHKGYSGLQVQLALGDPLSKALRHTGTDVAEAWTYRDRRIIFSHEGVALIEPLEADKPGDR